MRRPIGVAVVGFGWMGQVHTRAYLRVPHHFPQLELSPRLVAVADDVPVRAADAAADFGFATAVQDWRELLTDPRVEAVSITSPNFLHREMGTAFAAAGKHFWIEKPVGMDLDDARAVAAAAQQHAVRATVGFNYRNAPAVVAARDIIARGELGVITHARFRFLSDYAAHPEGALSWRFERSRGGNGVLGDLGSHGVDLAWFLLGDLAAVIADTAIFVPERARPRAATSGHTRAAGGERGRVENDDFMSALLRFTSGARATLEVSRVAVGEQNNYGFEIHGTKGAVFWDFRRMGELGLSIGGSYQDQPIQTVFAGPGHGAYAAFQPGSANAMSYDDLKVIEASHFLRSIAESASYGATLTDAVRSASVVEAIAESARTGRWVTL
jgi:predicted dehydrogenase